MPPSISRARSPRSMTPTSRTPRTSGFARAGGNVAVDPRLPFESAWYERFTRREGRGRKFDAKAWEETRTSAGLPATASPSPSSRLPIRRGPSPQLVTPGNASVGQGARATGLKLAFSTASAAAPAKVYARRSLASIQANPKGHDGRDVEVIVGSQGVANPDNGPVGTSRETHKAVFLVDEKNEARATGLFRKGHRRRARHRRHPQLRLGPARDLFVVRGTARAREGHPRYAIVIDSVEPFEKELAMARPSEGTGLVRTCRRDRGRWLTRAALPGPLPGVRAGPARRPHPAFRRASTAAS